MISKIKKITLGMKSDKNALFRKDLIHFIVLDKILAIKLKPENKYDEFK